MNDETENGTTPGIAAAVENLKAQATALAPSLTGTRSVSGWTGVAQVGAELVVEQTVEASDAAIAARAGAGEVQAVPLADRSAASIQAAFAAAATTDPDEAGALARLAGTIAEFLATHGTTAVHGITATAPTRRQAGVGIDLGEGAGSVLIYRRLTALTADSR